MSGETEHGRHAWAESGVFEVAPGVHRIPLPLPSDGLRAVNVYAIEDGGDLVLVDSGWALQEARDQLETALGKLGYGFENVRRFLVTHMHRDHYTLGVILRRTFGTHISLGIGEQPSLEVIMAGRNDGQLSRLHQWGASDLAELVRAAHDAGQAPDQDGFEEPDSWIDGNAEIHLRHRTLRVIPTPGHTRGHVVFLDSASRLLFSGDHVLPHITPSIGLEAAAATLPLGDYLDSLRLMRTYPDMRMLPAHGDVADSVHNRVDELIRHHDERLTLTKQAISEGAGTAYEAARRLGWTRREKRLDDLDVFNQVLAVGETAAHLDVLAVRGELATSAVDGVTGYRSVSVS